MGLAQLKVTNEVLKELKLSIPIISIAEQFEKFIQQQKRTLIVGQK